jgi:hypothetical protein
MRQPERSHPRAAKTRSSGQGRHEKQPAKLKSQPPNYWIVGGFSALALLLVIGVAIICLNLANSSTEPPSPQKSLPDNSSAQGPKKDQDQPGKPDPDKRNPPPDPERPHSVKAPPAQENEQQPQKLPEPEKVQGFKEMAVKFVKDPEEAMRLARQDKRLQFLLYVGGRIEDGRFTEKNAEALRENVLMNTEVGKYLSEHFVSAYQKVGPFILEGEKKQAEQTLPFYGTSIVGFAVAPLGPSPFAALSEFITGIPGDTFAKKTENVACYFCTPEGSVLHVVIGPVSGEVFLKEARWVVETWKAAALETGEFDSLLRVFYRRAHLERLRDDYEVDLSRLLRPPQYGMSTIPAALVVKQGKFDSLNPQGRIHLLLCAGPLLNVEEFYPVVLAKVLNENLSTKAEMKSTP